MKRFARACGALLLAAVLLGGLTASAGEADRAAGSVVIVLAPYVGWSDVVSGEMPVTRALAESSTIGNLNVRSSVRFAPDPNQMHIALTMSAGSPAAFDLTAASAYMADQPLEVGSAADAYRRAMGADPGDAALIYLGLPRVIGANQKSTLSTLPGALGQAIVDAGGSTAALGNSDGGYRNGDFQRSRPAAVIAMDATGLVRYGSVSSGLVTEKVDAPYGIATDVAALAVAYREALARTDAHGGPALVVLDPGDPERAARFAIDASPAAAEAHRVQAARTIDRVLELALDALPDDGVLMVVSTGQMKPASGPSGFGPVIISGPGYTGGLVASSSTHHLGLMTDLDVSATTLSILGIERPVEILGNPATAGPEAGSLDARVEHLNQQNRTAIAVDTVRPAVQNSYITITVLVLVACAALLSSMHRAIDGWGPRVASAFSALILLLMLMPVAATLQYIFVLRPGTALQVAGLFAATTAVIWAILTIVNRRWGSAVALAAAGLLSAGVLLADQLFGAPLSFSGMFSYSPLLGARYYGLGNEGASIVVGGGLAGLALLLDAFRDRPWTRPVRTFGPLLLGVVVVVLSAAPGFGANVGVAAWGTVAFGILWVQLNGRKVTWVTVLAMLGVIAAFVVAFSAFDLLSGSGGQTHLARAWESAGTGGISELWLIVARKAETNWRVLRATNWSILMIAILAFLAFMRWRPHGVFAETLKAYPAFAVAMTASLWGSLVGYFTEDSGIVIPALVMLYITGSLLHVMLSRIRAGAAADGA